MRGLSLVYILIKLVLILLVVIVTIKRAYFYNEYYKKNHLCNRMRDYWINDYLVTYIKQNKFDMDYSMLLKYQESSRTIIKKLFIFMDSFILWKNIYLIFKFHYFDIKIIIMTTFYSLWLNLFFLR